MTPAIAHPDDLLVAFVPGTYDLKTLLGSAPSPTYTLTIAAESASTPEPFTFALLGTGLLRPNGCGSATSSPALIFGR